LFNNSKLALDTAAFDSYIANHMTATLPAKKGSELSAGETKRRRTMNRFRYLAITTLIAALTALAQQTSAGPGGTAKDEHGQRAAQGDVPTVEQQLKVLTEKLDLSGSQQARITPILQELHDAQQKIVEDKSLSREERLAKVRPQRYKADKQIREVLSDDQKKKLDQYLQGPHPEMHGNLSGAVSSPQPQN
jgi:Spy/CpxP family protein refolding chaperone